MPTPYSRPSQHDRSRSRDADQARQGTARSDQTAQWNPSSVHAQQSTLQGTQAMDTTEFSDDLGVYEHGAEDLAGFSSQSPVAPIYESEHSHAKKQAQKDPTTTGDSFSWAYLHEWHFETGEPPMTHGEGTVPTVTESLPPTARPMPVSGRLPRTNFTQQSNSACCSGPICQHRQPWSSAISPTMPRGRTVPRRRDEPTPKRATIAHDAAMDPDTFQPHPALQQSGQQRACMPTPPDLEHRRSTDGAPQPNRPRRSRGAPTEPTAPTDPPPTKGAPGMQAVAR